MSLFQISPNSSVGDDASTTSPSITQLWTKQVHEDPAIPALFLAWAPENWFAKTPADGFAITFSDSRTAVFGTEGDLREKDSLVEWGTFEAKQMIEVWFVALSTASTTSDQTSPNIPFMFTGNDFGSLHTRRFDNTVELEDPDEHILPMLLEHDDRARHHTAGVTAILPLAVPLVDDAPVLLTGSYDEGLRVYHATRRGEVLAEQGLDGGVWRLQLLNTTQVPESADPSNVSEWSFLVLASCMHAGTRLVRVTCTQQDGTPEWGIEVLAKFTEHESMNYASGVWEGTKVGRGESGSGELLCVSSSFYDRRLCAWTADI